MLPPEPRVPGALYMIDLDEYFVVHAPRQTGKTTVLGALADDVNATGERVALVFSCEQAGAAGDDYGAAIDTILATITEEAFTQGLPPGHMPPSPWPDGPPEVRLRAGLSAWSRACPLPLVLLIDEIDSLSGRALITVLRQLRAGHNARTRGGPFPSSVVLCGMRNIRDYKAASGGNPETLNSASPFNVIVDSLRIADFTRDQVAELYGQHTAETGQEFTPEAVDRAFAYSQGQPWIVNALAREITVEMRVKPPTPITAKHIDEAKERVILARATHFDSLAARLREPRVQRVIEPLIAGADLPSVDATYDDDVSYAEDLGLIATGPDVKVANPIYREVIVRLLTAGTQRAIRVEPRSFLLPDGRIDFRKVLSEFAEFWDANGEILAAKEGYHETAAQLIFMAYLQRVVNGGGFVDREFGAGAGRIDILIRNPYTGDDGKPAMQKEAVELKVRRAKDGDPLSEGLEQLDQYLDRHHLDSGYMVIFDRRPEELRGHVFAEITDISTPAGRPVTLLRALQLAPVRVIRDASSVRHRWRRTPWQSGQVGEQSVEVSFWNEIGIGHCRQLTPVARQTDLVSQLRSTFIAHGDERSQCRDPVRDPQCAVPGPPGEVASRTRPAEPGQLADYPREVHALLGYEPGQIPGPRVAGLGQPLGGAQPVRAGYRGGRGRDHHEPPCAAISLLFSPT